MTNYFRNTDIQQAYFEGSSSPWRLHAGGALARQPRLRQAVEAVEAVMAAFKASPAHKEWEAAAVQHQRQRRRATASVPSGHSSR